MKIFEKIDRIPLKKFASYSSLLALIAALPISVYMAKQQTRSRVGASGDQYPSLTVNEEQIPYPKDPPEITNVEGKVGKVGDSVLIIGKNFGEAQKESYVKIGSFKIGDDYIPFWSDTEIEIKIPPEVKGGTVSVTIGEGKTAWGDEITVLKQ